MSMDATLLLNDPVNKAVADWTPQTLPADWPRYRLRWEIGQAAAQVKGVQKRPPIEQATAPG